MAYSVGLMASDGCLQSDNRHLDLTSVDIEQLKNFSRAIGRELPISTKRNKSKVDAFRIQFSDVSYYDFLLKTGLTPKKSKTIGHLNVPDIYYSHFLRGLFDGDGTTYGYFDPRWKDSFMYYISIGSASKNFLQYISLQNMRLFGVKNRSINRTTRAYILSYAKKDSYILYKEMYKNSHNLFLHRKYNKLENFIKQNGDAIIQSNARVP
ncbi:MAG: LAGLIDADG family homing endonuclease [Candidatus Saccharimonadaceae bacterium]|nr:LAGLIDADG family homing endonuclease [Candidatus Saccharimonadaceae bacterium]